MATSETGDTMLFEYHEMSKVVEQRYKCFASFIPEFYAVKHGIKPLSAQIIPAQVPEIYHKIKKLCDRNDIHTGTSNFRLYFDHEKKEHVKLSIDDPKKGGDLFLFVSKSKDLVKEAVVGGLEFESRATYFLGYPECCVRFYAEVGEDQNLRYTRAIQNSERFSFLLNNFLHWDGPYYLISHFPCSYDCEHSKQTAKRLLEAIEKEDQKLGKAIRFLLTRPVLYNGEKSHVRFNGGFVSTKEFRYDQVYAQRYPSVNRSFMNDEETLFYHNRLIDALEQGDRLIFGDQITIMNKKTVIDSLPIRKDTTMVEWK
jgi:hypothetical protein